MTQDWRHGGFGVYVHWPFCQAKCPYCDFNSHVSARIDQPRWARAYVREIARQATMVPDRTVGSIFIGGGTPSLMSPETVAEVIAAVRATWPAANDLEVTLEANPTSVEAGRFAGYRDAGVTRVSLGVQALDDVALKALGRLHSAAEARAAFDVARHQFERVSFDLIYARQHQTAAEWQAELTEALLMAVDHLSLYQLTIEDGTPFAARRAVGGLRGLPRDDVAADLYDLTQELCTDAGMAAYEVSNHSVKGMESKHNMIYWRSGDWLGVGPGAHGRVTTADGRWATVAPCAPGDWLTRVEQDRADALDRTLLSDADIAAEVLMMGLRLSEGVALPRLATLGFQPDGSVVDDLMTDGLIRLEEDRLSVTRQGRLLLNHVVARLLPD
ncbi:MAG: radical SAM family heme chaperone HemW [Alkalilacustris sp.]